MTTIEEKQGYTVSVIVPARNERGNIEILLKRLPALGSHTEIVLVEGNSTDGTAEEIRRVVQAYPEKDIKFLTQPGKGKADAVWHGFKHASCDILMILDADLSVDPEELTKFYDLMADGASKMVQGTRLIFPMEPAAMPTLNRFGNKFFAFAFSLILRQKLTDTLCGTKVIFRKDWPKIMEIHKYLGDFDPFGDFDLIFGTTLNGFPIKEVPIHYKARRYGKPNIARFRDGGTLFRILWTAVLHRRLLQKR
ncbi:MAG: glycosyltransferase family 2 protein [Parcubacteria group bacterium]|nr:glycosyltransferase family 2 protein [Parcubacteria group bacterium]